MRLPMYVLPVLLVAGFAAHDAKAADACEKKCYKAKTCAIVGPQCLEFDWCIDPCKGRSATPGDEAAPSKPDQGKDPLPGPNKEI